MLEEYDIPLIDDGEIPVSSCFLRIQMAPNKYHIVPVIVKN